MDGIPKGTRESTTLNIYKFALNHVFTGLKSKASIINCPTKRATCGRVNIKQNLFWSFNWSNSGQLKCENKTIRSWSYCLHFTRKWNSFSTSKVLTPAVTSLLEDFGCLQYLSQAAILTLWYRSVSTLRGKTPSLNRDKRFLTINGKHNLENFLRQQLVIKGWKQWVKGTNFWRL